MKEQPKKKSKIKQFKKPSAYDIMLLLIPVLLAFFVVAIYQLLSMQVTYTDLSEYKPATQEMKFYINNVDRTDNRLRFEGWAIEQGKTYEFYNFGWDRTESSVYNHNQFALIDGQKVLLIPSRATKADLGILHEGDELDYRQCGVIGEIPVFQIPIPDSGNYTVAIVLSRTNKEKFMLQSDVTLEELYGK